MADDQANEPFNLDGDFEGGRWVGGEGGEFMHEGEKKKRKMSKEEAIYGSFLEGMRGFGGGSDSDDDDGKGRKKKGSGFTLKGNAASGAPRFVSSGKYLQGDKKEEIADSEEDSPPEAASGNSGRFRDAMRKRDSRQSAPKSFGKQGSQRGRSAAAPTEDVANWEKHTKGIGSKLLSKMGWSGGGLGAEGSGIAKPIEVTLRPKNAGLGVNGIDKRQPDTRAQPREDRAAAEPQLGTVFAEDLDLERLWKRDSSKTKQKVVYHTAAGGAGPQHAQPAVSEPPKQVIIDMSGKDGPRVVTQLVDALRRDEPTTAGGRGAARKQFLPELGHNVKMLADLAEIGVQNIDRKMQQDRENMLRLEREASRLDQLLALEAKQLERLEDMQAIIQKCRQRLASAENPLTLEGLANVFDMLQQKYPEEYFVFNLSTLAFAMVSPALKARVESWNPLTAPTDPISTFRTWRTLLCRTDTPGQEVFGQQESSALKGAENDQYLRLVCEVVLPKMRSFLASQWNARRDCVKAVDLLRAWEEVLPAAALRSLLSMSVLPKLKLEVDQWNPLTDTVPIHVWLHPWLPMLGTAMEPLYIPIRQKLIRVLQAWHPSDPSAHALLLPWKDVWDELGMARLLSAAIEPKLAQTLSHEFEVNPAQQDLAPLQWVLAWRDMLPTAKLATLLDVFFFPKWLQVLHSWLIADPNFEEVTQWYLGWKELLPEEVLNQPRVKSLLGHALDMMNRAVSGTLPQQMPPLPAAGSVPPQQPSIVVAPRPPQLPGNEPSFKEVMQRFALDNGFLFGPGRRSHPQGKPTYLFGPVDVTLDKDIIYAYDKGKWLPVTLEELVSTAKRTPVK